jgi:hypothetical protein
MVHQPADGAEVPGDGRRCLWPEERCFCFALATWHNAEVGRATGWRIKRLEKTTYLSEPFFWSLNFDPHPFEHESSRSFAKHGESMFVPLSVECTERPRMILNPYTGFEEMSRICPMVIQKDPQVVCQRDGFKMTPFAAWRCFFAIF